MAKLGEISSSFSPYDVVTTEGGLSALARKLAVSISPVLKSALPFERNVTGTPAATPMVYSTSRSASVLHCQDCELLPIIANVKKAVDLLKIVGSLRVSAIVDGPKSEGRRRIDIGSELLQEALEKIFMRAGY